MYEKISTVSKKGRPKGYSPYIEIRYEDLADWVGRKTKIPVSKKWLTSLIDENADSDCFDHIKSEPSTLEKTVEIVAEKPKIEYTLTEL